MIDNFTHLHVHSAKGSFLDSTNTAEQLVAKAKELNMTALAITEHGYTSNHIDIYKECLKQGIKPILGVEMYECKDMNVKDPKDKFDHLLLLAKNNTGYKNILKISSAGFTKGFYYKPRVDLKYIKEHNLGEGVICTTACLGGRVPRMFAENKSKAEMIEVINQYKEVFDEVYLEIQPVIPDKINEGSQAKVNSVLAGLSKITNTPLVATSDVHFLNKEDFELHNVFIQIGQHRSNELYANCWFKTKEEMLEGFYLDGQPLLPVAQIEEAINNTMVIAGKCNVEIQLGKSELPTIDLPEGCENSDKLLMDLIIEGCKTRGLSNYPPEKKRIYWERIKEEYEVITKKGFSDYFLLEMIIMQIAEKNNIRMGLGRGSACGSLICYLLGITQVDSIEYDLIFSRFLTIERTELPDIDNDVQTSRRQDLINAIKDYFGHDKVAQICTFGALQSRSCLKAVGKVLGYEYSVMDGLSKKIPDGTSLIDAVKEVNDIKLEYKNYKKLFDYAIALESLERGISVHAGGVVITPKHKDINDYCAIALSKDGEEITQLEMHNVEEVGLVKIDVLGLNTLDVIDDCVKAIKKKQPDFNLWETIKNFDDKKTWEMYCKGYTQGVFQMDSDGMRNTVLQIQPKNIFELTNIIALYRPATMQGLQRYIKKTKGLIDVSYAHPDLKPVLESTLGELIYQEQAMKITEVFADFTPAMQDRWRKGMAKKKVEILEELIPLFRANALKKGYSEQFIEHLIEIMEQGASYSFNKSHAVAYAMTSYETAFLKANYPIEFFCSLLTNQKKFGSLDKDSLTSYLKECKKIGIKVQSPDINNSHLEFSPLDDKTIVYGFNTLRDLTENMTKEIIEQRSIKSFTSFDDFYKRVTDNKASVIALIKSGAFDCFNRDRMEILKHYRDLRFINGRETKKILKSATKSHVEQLLKAEKLSDDDLFLVGDMRFSNKQDAKDYGKQLGIKATDIEIHWKTYMGNVILPKINEYNKEQVIEEWNKTECKGSEDIWEYHYLSYSISNDPFEGLEYPDWDKTTDGDFIEIPAIIANVKARNIKSGTNKGKEMAIITLDTPTGERNALCFAFHWEKEKKKLEKGNKVILKCKKNGNDAIIMGSIPFDKFLQQYNN